MSGKTLLPKQKLNGANFLNQILKPKTRQRPEVGDLQSSYIENELCMLCCSGKGKSTI